MGNTELGFVIIRLDTNYYYNGMNQWKKDIRDAKIYHTQKGALSTMGYKFPPGLKLDIKKVKMEVLDNE